jgi:DNA-binding NarL/FixJ family response regulator
MHVLIVDDHPLLIKGVEALLLELDPSVTTAGARSIDQAIERAQAWAPDLILLDLNLPGMKDLDALVRMRRTFPEIPIVVVSANDNPEHIWRAIELGAAGYIPKDTDQQLMIQALRIVLARGIYLPPHAVRSGAEPSAAAPATGPKPTLSARQMSVLRGLLQGKSNKVIARELDIAEGTVKAHLSSIYLALAVSSRLQAMVRAYELALVDEFKATG